MTFPPRWNFGLEPRATPSDFKDDVVRQAIAGGGTRIGDFLDTARLYEVDTVWADALLRDFAGYDVEGDPSPEVRILLKTALPVALLELRTQLANLQWTICCLELVQKQVEALADKSVSAQATELLADMLKNDLGDGRWTLPEGWQWKEYAGRWSAEFTTGPRLLGDEQFLDEKHMKIVILVGLRNQLDPWTARQKG